MNKVKVIIDSPQKNSSLIYITDFNCLDPIIVIDFNEIKVGWFPSTEFEKAKKNSKLTDLKNLSSEMEELKKNKKYPILKSSLIIDWLKEKNIKEIQVPESFPSIEYENLIDHGFQIEIIEEPFYKRRSIKKEYEIDYIRNNSKINCEVMKEVYEILAKSKITNDNKLLYEGELLKSEFLQNYILSSFINKNMLSDSVIASIGDQGCFPHEYGSGFVYAHTSIIVDIFPKNRNNLYFTDMTRTFCKGKASDELKKLYQSVLDAQNFGLDKIKSNEHGAEIHKKIQNYFFDKGYRTGIINGTLQGFFHGTGHGVGLDCHEFPYISSNGTLLEKDSVVTVEPGLYYLGIGGVRIEDIVAVKDDGVENFIDFEKRLEIE